MVEEFKKILSVLEKQEKPVWLFASLKMDKFVDKWSLVISAPWINENNRNDEFENVFNIIKNNMAEEKLSSIARIVFLPKDDRLIEELLKKQSGEKINEEKINGNIIHNGSIIESNANLQWEENKNLKLDDIDKQ